MGTPRVLRLRPLDDDTRPARGDGSRLVALEHQGVEAIAVFEESRDLRRERAVGVTRAHELDDAARGCRQTNPRTPRESSSYGASHTSPKPVS